MRSTPPEVAPPRGAWIEIVTYAVWGSSFCRRPPEGGRGLKCCLIRLPRLIGRVAPLAGRGLKFAGRRLASLPVASPPSGGRGLKSWGFDEEDDRCRRPPSREAWIEIALSIR